MEALRMIEAPSLTTGSAFWTVKMVPLTLTSKLWSYTSSLSCSRAANAAVPALANGTSRP